jgi:predicted nuclease of predicted toxin-antitoxin system
MSPPAGNSLFVDGLLDFAAEIGNVASAIAIGNWKAKINNTLAVNLSEKGFELIHMPQPDDKGKRKKNSSDFVLITKATEMIFQYPHIRTYILLTGDIDFRPLLQTLKKHGKRIIVVCDSNTASENLLEFADEYTDYRNLIPDDASETVGDTPAGVGELKREAAFTLLAEAVVVMQQQKKIPTPGSVKVRMQLLNESFSGKIKGYTHWQEFIQDAAKQEIIAIANTEKGMTLSVPSAKKTRRSLSDMPAIIKILLDVIHEIAPTKKWIHFAQVSNALIEKGINIKEYNYSKLKKLILDAEKRNLVETKNNNMRWFVRKR